MKLPFSTPCWIMLVIPSFWLRQLQLMVCPRESLTTRWLNIPLNLLRTRLVNQISEGDCPVILTSFSTTSILSSSRSMTWWLRRPTDGCFSRWFSDESDEVSQVSVRLVIIYQSRLVLSTIVIITAPFSSPTALEKVDRASGHRREI